MRVAVIGLAGMGRTHIEGIRRSGAATEIIGCDLDARLAGEAAAAYGIRVFTDLEQLLVEARPAAAFVVTPPAAHAANIRACFAHGIAVLTEKPICTHAKEAAELVAIARDRRIPFQCGFQLRYAGWMDAIRAVIAEGAIGRVTQASLTQFSGPIPKPGYFDRDRVGGIFYEKLCHQVDQFRLLFGEPERCMAIAAPRAIGHYGVDDNATAVFAFAGGVLGIVRFETRRSAQVAGETKPERQFEGHDAGHLYEFTVSGERGSATFDYWTDTVEVMRYNHRPDLLTERVRVIDRPREFPGDPYDTAAQDGDFLRRVARGEALRHPAEDALRTMDWVERAEASLRAGGAWIDAAAGARREGRQSSAG
ncbi:MAG TPA: Gfo/Idh/MocA family oxidoreductase [Planctomycetota bacterium]|nr:Gfo/Idh/MocA family oxidoreductase [Planctomycetota bacterium]